MKTIEEQKQIIEVINTAQYVDNYLSSLTNEFLQKLTSEAYEDTCKAATENKDSDRRCRWRWWRRCCVEMNKRGLKNIKETL